MRSSGLAFQRAGSGSSSSPTAPNVARRCRIVLERRDASLAMRPPYFFAGPSVLPADLRVPTLALLRDPFAFTQTRLLSPDAFTREAKERGVRLRRGELEVLHRRRVLQPFFVIHSRPVADPGLSPAPPDFLGSPVDGIRLAFAEGRLSDPALRRFAPWPRSSSRSSLWYSHHQLLLLRHIPRLQAHMQAHQEAGQLVSHLAPLDAHTKAMFARERALAFLIEALASKYRSRVVGSLRFGGLGTEQDLLRFINSDEDVPGLQEIDLPSEVFVDQADRLLAEAHGFDPLGDWSEVVRIADQRRWGDLRFDALVAHEYRIAAEMFLRFVEDQARRGLADPIDAPLPGFFHPRQQRLRVDDRERAKTVMRFGTSDRPSLVLAVEGDAEYEIVPRVLDMMGYDPLASRISVVNMKSVYSDVTFLARAVAVPRLNPAGDRYADLLSPLTSLMVVVDPEGPYESHEGAEAEKGKMVESVLRSLPAPLRTDAMRNDLALILHIRRWSEEFEFANWSNQELAIALQSISQHAGSIPLDDLTSHISKHRNSRDTLSSVWTNWRPQTPSKVKLARALWPSLEDRIRTSPTAEEIPIVEVIREAIKLMREVDGVNAMAPHRTPAS